MYPPLYDKLKELRKQKWHYPHKNAKRRKAMLKANNWLQTIENMVKQYGLEGVLLTDTQKARIEKLYANFERDGVVR